MPLKNDIKDNAKEQALRLLAEAEKKRAAARFERGLVDLEQGNFSILGNTEFVEKIWTYLYEKYRSSEGEKATILLEF